MMKFHFLIELFFGQVAMIIVMGKIALDLMQMPVDAREVVSYVLAKTLLADQVKFLLVSGINLEAHFDRLQKFMLYYFDPGAGVIKLLHEISDGNNEVCTKTGKGAPLLLDAEPNREPGREQREQEASDDPQEVIQSDVTSQTEDEIQKEIRPLS